MLQLQEVSPELSEAPSARVHSEVVLMGAVCQTVASHSAAGLSHPLFWKYQGMSVLQLLMGISITPLPEQELSIPLPENLH